MVQVLEPIPEITTTELLSILKLETEDVLLETLASFNAEDMVDQTKMTEAHKLMSDAQDHHTRDLHSTESVQNSLSAETHTPDMSGERPAMVLGDHSLLITSGITITVLKLFAETCIMELVQEPRPEDKKTKRNSIPKPVTEDALLTTTRSWIAESMEDQTKMTSVLKLMLDAQVYHTRDHHSEEPEMNSPLMVQLKVTYGERPAMENGDHLLLTTSGITTTVPQLSVDL
jgi:hypothetical protein